MCGLAASKTKGPLRRPAFGPRSDSIQARLAALLFGLCLTALILGALEIAFWRANIERFPKEQLEHHNSPGSWNADPRLGAVPAPGGTHVETVRKGNELVFRARYTIDANGRRVVPHSPPIDAAPRSRFLLCFGCSFMFGVGVQDDQTLPASLARRAPEFHVYNCAAGGWGPHHTLALLERGDLRRQVAEEHGMAIYLYLPFHCRRALGSMRTVTRFGRNGPCYEFDDNGQVIYRGSFAHARPRRQVLYGLLARDQILKFFHVDFPAMNSTAKAAFGADILRAAADRYERLFGNDRFYVVLYPAATDTLDVLDVQAPVLESRGLRVINYARLFDCAAPAMVIPHDRHPSPRAYEILAERIAADLGLSSPADFDTVAQR